MFITVIFFIMFVLWKNYTTDKNVLVNSKKENRGVKMEI